MTLSQTLSNFLFQGFSYGLADAIHDFGLVLLAKQAEIELLVFPFISQIRAGFVSLPPPLGRSSLGFATHSTALLSHASQRIDLLCTASQRLEILLVIVSFLFDAYQFEPSVVSTVCWAPGSDADSSSSDF